MKLRLKTILIGTILVFVILVFLKVSKLTPKIIKFFRLYYEYILFFIFLLIMGFLIYKFFQKKQANQDMSKKCFDYLNNWWCNDMKQNETFKFEDARMSEGWYGNEKFYGFNLTKKDSNTRFLAVIGTNPIRMVHFDNSPNIKEDDTPFASFYNTPPKPTQDYQVTPTFGLPSYSKPKTHRTKKRIPKNSSYNNYYSSFDTGEDEDYEE